MSDEAIPKEGAWRRCCRYWFSESSPESSSDATTLTATVQYSAVQYRHRMHSLQRSHTMLVWLPLCAESTVRKATVLQGVTERKCRFAA